MAGEFIRYHQHHGRLYRQLITLWAFKGRVRATYKTSLAWHEPYDKVTTDLQHELHFGAGSLWLELSFRTPR